MAEQADHVVALDGSHSPMLAQPDVVAGILAGIAANVQTEGAH
jgi:hypothetical protein